MKNILIKIILHFLYRGIKVLNGRDSLISQEIKSLLNGYTVKIESDIKKPISLCLKVENGKVKKINKKENCKFDLIIKFKHKNLAFKVLMGKVSISNAYAWHYFQLFGNIYDAMAVTRTLERTEGYLFPKFINKKILKKEFKREISIFKTYMLCLF